MQLLLIIGLFVIATNGLKLINIFQFLRQGRYSMPQIRVRLPEELPVKYQDCADYAHSMLTPLGFELTAVLSDVGSCTSTADFWFIIYRHPNERALATVVLSSLAALTRTPSVYYDTRFHSGSSIVTSSVFQHLLRKEQKVLTFDKQSIPALWDTHLKRVAEVPAAEERLEVTDALLPNVLRSEQTEAFKQSAERGELVTLVGGQYALGLLACLKLSIRVMFAPRPKRHSAEPGSNASTTPSPFPKSSPSEIEAASHVSLEDSASRSDTAAARKSSSLIFSVLGVLLSAAFLGVAPVVMFLLIILLHELGHSLTMKAFGYRNVHITLFPFLGGFASGEKNDAPGWQRYLVLLAGPLPGLLLGAAACAVALWQPAGYQLPAFLFTPVLFLIVINAFNLLPILPLDGGRMLEITLLERWGLGRVIFGALSIFGLLAISWRLQDPFLGGFSLLLLPTLLNFKNDMQAHAIAGKLRERIQSGQLLRTREALTEAAFALIGDKESFAVRSAWVKQIVTRVQSRPLSVPGCIIGTLIYLSLIAAPFFGADILIKRRGFERGIGIFTSGSAGKIHYRGDKTTLRHLKRAKKKLLDKKARRSASISGGRGLHNLGAVKC